MSNDSHFNLSRKSNRKSFITKYPIRAHSRYPQFILNKKLP